MGEMVSVSDEILRLRCSANGMTDWERLDERWVPAFARTREGLGPHVREDKGRGMVPAFARTGEGDGFPPPRE